MLNIVLVECEFDFEVCVLLDFDVYDVLRKL